MSEITPVICAECRGQIPIGATCFVLDRTQVAFGQLNTGCPGSRDTLVESNDPATLCSKTCTRRRIARL